VKNRLSESEERELIRRAKAGDDGARNRLWEAFFPFALSECRKQAELASVDADIAEGEAALAIPEAISRFDLRRQTRFSTYLAHRLRGAITAATREHRRSSIFDKAQYFPDQQETPAEWSEDPAALGGRSLVAAGDPVGSTASPPERPNDREMALAGSSPENAGRGCSQAWDQPISGVSASTNSHEIDPTDCTRYSFRSGP